MYKDRDSLLKRFSKRHETPEDGRKGAQSESQMVEMVSTRMR
jgi:hypothetical protein